MQGAEATSSLALGVISTGLFGGLALFLAGMEQMSEALKAVAGEGMRKILARLTRNRFMAAGTGAFVTAIIQSSSVTTVLVVGFITAGIMTLSQSVGVIMGANVGTTITAQIVAFKVTEYALVLIAVGFGMNFFVKKEKVKLYGAMLMGLGLIFFGMGLMSDATSPLRDYQPFIDLMASMSNPLLGILVAAAFTGLVQSSSATTGIVIVLASQGFITLEAGIALAFGANIGTCVTALLATLGKPRVAMQAAAVHVLFNVLGVLLWVFFIPQLAEVVRSISPTAEGLQGAERLGAEAPRQIANAHTIFNIANTVIFIWFTVPLAALVRRLVPEKPAVMPERAKPIYLDEVYFETPVFALGRVRLELVRLAEGVQEMLHAVSPAVGAGTREDLKEIVAMNDDSTLLYESIVTYLAKLSQLPLTSTQTTRLGHLSSIVNTIGHMGDTIATNLVSLGEQRIDADIRPSEVTTEAFKPLGDAVREALRLAIEAAREEDVNKAREVIAMKEKIQSMARDVNAHLARRVTAGEPNRLILYRIETDAVEILQRLYYFTKRIAKSALEAREADEGSDEKAALSA